MYNINAHSNKEYHFRTPSNEHIILNCMYVYKDIVTVNDLKYLFTMKIRAYEMDTFDLARIINTRTNEMEILDLNTNLSELANVLEYQVIHKNLVMKYQDVQEEKQDDVAELAEPKETVVDKDQTQPENKIIETVVSKETDVVKEAVESKYQVQIENKICETDVSKQTDVSNKQDDKKTSCIIV